MQAILIDPETRTITTVEHSGDFHDIHRHIDAQTFDVARFDPESNDAAFVDDEGLLKAEPGPFFMIEEYPEPLAGKALVLGANNEGETTAPANSRSDIVRRVRWALPHWLD
jgi:hypothetical protein